MTPGRISFAATIAFALLSVPARAETIQVTIDKLVFAPADVTVHTPDQVWVDIAAGRLDGTQAIADGRYTVEGDYLMLAKLPQWFPTKAPGT